MNYNQSDDVSKILDNIDIVELVSEFTELEKRGKNYFGLCPFHDEKTPSFSVSPEKKLAVCMGCGEGGNTITFYSKIKNISFREALGELANRAGIKISASKAEVDPNLHLYKLLDEVKNFYVQYLYFSNTGQNAIKYLEKRNISKEMIEKYKLGFAPEKNDALYQFMKEKKFSTSDLLDLGLVRQNEKGDYYDYFSNRLIFPITNPKGQTVGFSARGLSSSEKVKYLNSPESKIFYKGEILYNLFEASSAIRKQKEIYLTEGFFDVIKADQNGLSNVVATMGTALTQQQVSLLARFTSQVVIAFDGDNAGLKANLAATKSILTNSKLKASVLSLPNKMDLDDLFTKYPNEKGLEVINKRKMDAIKFAYRYLLRGKDLTSSGDLEAFKRDFETVIASQSQTVFNYFEKLFKDENQFDIKFRKIKTIQQPRSNYLSEDKARFDESNIPNDQQLVQPTQGGIRFENDIKRIEQAQREIIIDLVLQREHFDLVKRELDLSDIYNDNHMNILRAIISYYNQLADREFIDLDLFCELNEKLREIINNEIKSKLHWKNNIKIEYVDEVIHKINLIKQSEQYYRVLDLQKKINKQGDNVNADDLVEYQKLVSIINQNNIN